MEDRKTGLATEERASAVLLFATTCRQLMFSERLGVWQTAPVPARVTLLDIIGRNVSPPRNQIPACYGLQEGTDRHAQKSRLLRIALTR